jgi:hypothetical protein
MPNNDMKNKFSFSPLGGFCSGNVPNGNYEGSLQFCWLDGQGHWYTSTDCNLTEKTIAEFNSFEIYIDKGNINVYMNCGSQTSGFSIRCLKD